MQNKQLQIQLTHQPDLPINLQFQTNLNNQQIKSFTQQTIENILYLYDQSLSAITITDITNPNKHKNLPFDSISFQNNQKILINMNLENVNVEMSKDENSVNQTINHNNNKNSYLYDLKQLDTEDIKVEGNHKSIHYLLQTSAVDLVSDCQEDKVLSRNRSVGLLSYLPQKTQIDVKSGPPVYMKYDDLPNGKNTEHDQLYYGFIMTKQGEFKLVDQDKLSRYKGLISEMIKKISQSVAEGRGMVGVSLPVRIFEPRSTIERITDLWGYLDNYLPRCIANPTSIDDKIFNLKQVMAFAFSGLSLSVNILKPFNPLLGETYQGVFKSGSQLMIEHISHHPPISYFNILNTEFKIEGSYEYIAKTNSTFNQITLKYSGPNIVYLKNQKIEYNMPECQMGGMIIGDKLCSFKKSMVFVDYQNRLKAVILFGYSKNPNGKLVKTKANMVYGQLYQFDISKKVTKFDDIVKMFDLQKQYCEIEGDYTCYLKIAGQDVWNNQVDVPSLVSPIQNPLPSDWRFREDLIWLHYNDRVQSERWKVKLEMEQRRHRKLRANSKKKK